MKIRSQRRCASRGVRGLVACALRGLRVAALATALLPGAAFADACERLALDATIARLVPRIESFTLANGLRVHLVRRPGESSVAVRVAYDVGSRDDPEGRSGVAHLFEHMMFKGSAHVGDGGHFRIVRDAGGRTNAQTDYDTTEYWDTVPGEALGRVLFAEADRMHDIQITSANLDNQRAAIQEEGLGLANTPYVAAAAAFASRLWTGTPYARSPLGTDEEIGRMTEGEARHFHARYYGPSNAVLVVVGGFDARAMRDRIEREFGVIRGSARASDRRRTPFELDRRARSDVVDDPLAPFPVYAVVWHGVGARDSDAPALALVDDLLMGHADARLSRAIDGTLALDAYALSFALRDVGLLNYVFAPRTFVGFDDIERVLRREIGRLRSEGPQPGELCRSRLRKQTERLAALGTNEGVAAAIARGALLHDDPRHFEAELHQLGALDVETVRRAAARYLVDDFSTLEIRAAGLMRWLKPVLEFLPASVGSALERMLL